MSKRLSIIIVAAALLLPAAAQAAPSVDVTGPVTGKCVGGQDQKIEGTIASPQWDASSYVARSIQREDTGDVVWSRQTNGFAPFLGTFDTRSLPTDVDLSLTVLVHAPDGNAADTIDRLRWVFDRTNPTAPTVKAIRAVAGLQVLTEISGAADLGCSGGVASLDVLARDQNNVPLFGLGTLPSLFANGNLSTGGVIRSPSVLSLGSHYGAQAISTDGVGNQAAGAVLTFDTPGNAYVHVAGKLLDSHGNRLRNVLVTATGGGFPPPPARSNGDGWYDLAVPESSQPWTLTYSSPDCDPGGFMEKYHYCYRVVTTTDTAYTGGLSGQILWPLKSKTLVTP